MPPAAIRSDSQRLLREIVASAVLAPSSHNTQPWRFQLYDDRLEMYADRTRALPVNDPHDRELTISCGAALLNARVAAAHAGSTLDVELLPEGDGTDLLARATLTDGPSADGRLFSAISRRHTHRGEFEDRDVPGDLLGQLADAAGGEGAWLEILNAGQRARLASLVNAGDRTQFADGPWRHELASWMHPHRKGDGLAVPEIAAPIIRFIVSHFDVGGRTAQKNAKAAQAAAVIAILATSEDTAADWLRAGQALERLLLTAAGSGFQASYLNQPIQVEALRPHVDELLSDTGSTQIALRLGYPTQPCALAPRRPLETAIERIARRSASGRPAGTPGSNEAPVDVDGTWP